VGANGRIGPVMSDSSENHSIPCPVLSDSSGGVGLVCGMKRGIESHPHHRLTCPLTSDRVVNGRYHWRRQGDAKSSQDWNKGCPKGIEICLRFPNIEYLNGAVRL
jgi:hypothetical protein